MSQDLKLIHLSDLHIGLGDKERKNTKILFRHIAKTYPSIPVVITGDIVDSGLEDEMLEAEDLIDMLCKTNPVIPVPGNHDYAWKGNILLPDARERWMRYIDKSTLRGLEGISYSECITIYWHGDVHYYSVDSADPGDQEVAARGYISDKQAEALERNLAGHKSSFINVVVLHHHPFTDGWFTALEGSEKLLEAVSGNCELLLFGHDHKYGIWWGKHDIPLIVSSHKSTDPISGDCLAFTVIEKKGDQFTHRLEVI